MQDRVSAGPVGAGIETAPDSEVLANLDVGYAAYDRGDYDTVLTFLSDDVVWEQPPGVPECQVFRGKAEIRGWFERFDEIFTDTALRATEIHQVGDWYVVRVWVKGRGRASDVEIDMRFVQAWHWNGEKFDHVKERTSFKKTVAELQGV